MAIRKNEVPRANLLPVERLVAHSLCDEAIKLCNGFVACIWAQVSLSKAVSYLTEPSFSTYDLWNHLVVGNDVHVRPEAVEQIMVPLVVHSHLENVQSWKVARSSRTDHLPVVNDALVGGAHRIKIFTLVVRHKKHISLPLVLSQVLSYIFLALASRLQRDYGQKIVERARFG